MNGMVGAGGNFSAGVTQLLFFTSSKYSTWTGADSDGDDDHGLHDASGIRAFSSVAEHVLTTVKECDKGCLLGVGVERAGEAVRWN